MTPSYYNKLTGHSHFATDVELVCNFPVAQFKIMVYCKKPKETQPFCLCSFQTFRHDIWVENIDNIRIFKSGGLKINSRDRTGGEGAHTNINKHSSSVSEASCFIWLGWRRREGWGWKTEQSCSFAFLPSFPSSAIFSLPLMGMGSLGSGGGVEEGWGGL